MEAVKREADPDFYAGGGWGDTPESVEQIVVETIATHGMGLGGSLLDAACGDGRFAQTFHRLGFDATGFDVSADAIATAEETYPGPRYVVADAEKPLPFPDKSFDFIYCRGISHTAKPRSAESDKVFWNLRRVLRWNGLLILERNTDGTGVPGPSDYFPGQLKANPSAHQLRALVSTAFVVRQVLQLDGRIQIAAVAG